MSAPSNLHPMADAVSTENLTSRLAAIHDQLKLLADYL
jgi:hypothetical protein